MKSEKAKSVPMDLEEEKKKDGVEVKEENE